MLGNTGKYFLLWHLLKVPHITEGCCQFIKIISANRLWVCASLSQAGAQFEPNNIPRAVTRLTAPSHHSLHKYVDNDCDLPLCITLLIQPEWLVLANSIKARWLQWWRGTVQYSCFSDIVLSHRDAPTATVKRHTCLAVHKLATVRRVSRGGGAEPRLGVRHESKQETWPLSSPSSSLLPC